MNKKKIMKWVILVAIIIIPVMYSFFYLKAFIYPNTQNNKFVSHRTNFFINVSSTWP